MDFGRRLSKGLISPLSPAIPQTDSYFPDGPSNPSVKPLPSRRKRTLTCTYRPGVDPGQVTHDQLQAPLFSKLPLELRLLIWEAALGDGHLHIRPNPDSRKLEHLRCKDPSHAKHDCWRVFGWDRSSKSMSYDYGLPAKNGQNLFEPAEEGLLALPLTCRRIYTESLPALYMLNTFSFSSFDPIISFSASILPHRFNQIQSLDIDISFVFLQFDPTSSNWAGCNDKLVWERAWRVIASMRGLRDLNVKLVDLCTNSTVDLVSMLEADVETELWEPVKAVSRPRRFVIETNLRENAGVELDNAPFEVVRLPDSEK